MQNWINIKFFSPQIISSWLLTDIAIRREWSAVYDEIRQWVFFTPLRFNGKFPVILLVTWKQRRMSRETFWHPVHHAHFLHLVILRIQYLCIEAGWSWQVPFLDAGSYIILPSLLNSYFSKSLIKRNLDLLNPGI